MEEKDIYQRLEGIRNLPTLPAVINSLGVAIRDPKSDASRIGSIIEDDPAMMARILKVVNSVFYGGVEPIHSVRQAVARIGFNAINNIAMTTSVFSAFGESESTGFNREEFWRHCITTGIATQVIYDRVQGNLSRKYDSHLLHLAGLVHDIGKIVFEQSFHEEFLDALHSAKEAHLTLQEAEQEVIGTDHTAIGAWLGRKWNLSDELLETVEWHHEPDKAPGGCGDLTLLCHCANYVCNIEGLGDSGDLTAPAFRRPVWDRLGLEIGAIPEIVDRIGQESEKSEILLSLI